MMMTAHQKVQRLYFVVFILSCLLMLQYILLVGNFSTVTLSSYSTIQCNSDDRDSVGEKFLGRASQHARNFTEELMYLAGTKQQEAVARSCNQSGLYAVQDLVLPESVTHQGRKIPKVIHITSKSRCMTKPFYDNVENWKIKGYSLYFHDDDAKYRLFFNSSQFLESWSELPDMGYILACMKNRGAMLADMWRYLLIYEYGGVYVDIDDAPGETMLNGDPDTLIGASVDAVLVRPSQTGMAQYFFAMSRKHPLLFHTLLKTYRNLFDTEDIMKQYVPYVTGVTLRDAWRKLVSPSLFEGEFKLNNLVDGADLTGIRYNKAVSDQIVQHDPEFLSGKVEQDYINAVKITDYNRNYAKVKISKNQITCHDALYDAHVRKSGKVFNLVSPGNFTLKKKNNTKL